MKLIALKTVPSSVGQIVCGQAFNAGDGHAQELIRSGHARVDDGTEPAWDGIRWPAASVVILASGPSLTTDQCDAVRAWHALGGARRVIAVNTTFRRAPWADVLYACDAPWWKLYIKEVRGCFDGQLWTQDEQAGQAHGINRVQSLCLPGLGKRAGTIHQGGNSGYQAINIAWQAGAARIILLGFDHHGTRWHGPYTNGLPNPGSHLMDMWLRDAAPMAADLSAAGIEVLNCSPGTALTCFPITNLSEALA